jgi:hypothetical protein
MQKKSSLAAKISVISNADRGIENRVIWRSGDPVIGKAKKNEIGAKEEEIRRFHGRNGSKKSPADSSPLRGSE